MNNSLFSVGIVAYNQHQYILKCIDSILKQDYPQLELIIADDHSYDFDRQAIEDYIKKHQRANLVRYAIFSNDENLGIVRNCNKCISYMTGKYIKTIAADDMFYCNNALTKMHQILDDEDVQIVCSRAKAITAEGKPTQDIYPTDYDFNTISNMSSHELYVYMITRPWCPIFAPCVFMKKDFFDKMGRYDEKYRYTEDWPFWVKIARAGYNITFSDEITIRYRYGGISNKGTNEFSINHLRAKHYQECAELLRGELPYLKQIGSKMQVKRCRYSADAIEMRRELECFWKHASFKHKLSFRLAKIRTILYIKLMSAITHKTRFHIYTESVIGCILGILLYFQVPLCPWSASMKLEAGVFLFVILLLICKIAANMILALLSGRAAILTRLRRK